MGVLPTAEPPQVEPTPGGRGASEPLRAPPDAPPRSPDICYLRTKYMVVVLKIHYQKGNAYAHESKIVVHSRLDLHCDLMTSLSQTLVYLPKALLEQLPTDTYEHYYTCQRHVACLGSSFGTCSSPVRGGPRVSQRHEQLSAFNMNVHLHVPTWKAPVLLGCRPAPISPLMDAL